MLSHATQALSTLRKRDMAFVIVYFLIILLVFLVSCCRKSHGLSGRTLRKIPFLAHARHIQVNFGRLVPFHSFGKKLIFELALRARYIYDTLTSNPKVILTNPQKISYECKF